VIPPRNSRQSARLSGRCRRPAALPSAPSPCKQGGGRLERSEVKSQLQAPSGFPDPGQPTRRRQAKQQRPPGHHRWRRTPTSHCSITGGGLAGQGAETLVNRHRAPTQTAPGQGFGRPVHKIGGAAAKPLRIGRQEQAWPDRRRLGQPLRADSGRPAFEKTPRGWPERMPAPSPESLTATATAVLPGQ